MSSALQRLYARPRRYRFDAAARLLLHRARTSDPAEAVRFRTPLGAAYPGPEVIEIAEGDDGRPVMTSAVMGLAGPTSVLPEQYTALVYAGVRGRSTALRDFLELLSQRFVVHFVSAGMKYRSHRVAEAARFGPAGPELVQNDRVTKMLLALVGYGTSDLASRLAVGQTPLLHYAGLLSMRPRSADRLAAMLSDWLGRPVRVEQFAGDWLSLPPSERTRMSKGLQPGAFNRLGVDAAIGVRAWDVQARVVLRIGPLDSAGFASLLPDGKLLSRLVSLTRAFLGFETGFAVNPVLAAASVPALRLAPGDARLGWNSWLPSYGRRPDAADAIFTAEAVEAEQARTQ